MWVSKCYVIDFLLCINFMDHQEHFNETQQTGGRVTLPFHFDT